MIVSNELNSSFYLKFNFAVTHKQFFNFFLTFDFFLFWDTGVLDSTSPGSWMLGYRQYHQAPQLALLLVKNESRSLLVCPVLHGAWDLVEKGDTVCISLLSSWKERWLSPRLLFRLTEESSGRGVRVLYFAVWAFCGSSDESHPC